MLRGTIRIEVRHRIRKDALRSIFTVMGTEFGDNLGTVLGCVLSQQSKREIVLLPGQKMRINQRSATSCLKGKKLTRSAIILIKLVTSIKIPMCQY